MYNYYVKYRAELGLNPPLPAFSVLVFDAHSMNKTDIGGHGGVDSLYREHSRVKYESPPTMPTYDSMNKNDMS